MEATAQVRHLRVTAQKARRVVDLARGGVAADVVASLRFQPQAVAEPVRKVIESAMANARVKADEAGERLDDSDLVTLFAWSASEFEERLRGSAIRRIGYERWLRNLAVGLGNARYDVACVAALATRRDDPSPLVREHVAWALAEQLRKGGKPAPSRSTAHAR